jgi:hypothetical protein
MDSQDRREDIRREALRAGFDRVGFARSGPAPHADRFQDWLARGFAGTMDYLGRTAARRSDPCAVLEGARTVMAFFGPAGAAWVRFLGGPASVALLLSSAAVLWVALPAAAGIIAFRRRDL